jgi:hypothetical protein
VADQEQISPQHFWALASFAVDRTTAEISEAFAGAGVRSILLKGPAIAEWLYKGEALRAYADTDLLISSADWEKASSLLKGLGFEDGLEALGHPRMESFTSYPWKREQPAADVDLHTTLWGIEAPPERVWERLSRDTATLRVGGRDVEILGEGPRALHIALHVAQHGPAPRKPTTDLQLALAKLPFEVWQAAAETAQQLDATDAFATALNYTPEGAALARRLGVDDRRSVDALLRQSQVPLAEGFQELSTTPGLRGKLSLIRRELVPTPEFMRWWSPLARRGKLGLAAAYVWRVLLTTWRVIPGFLAWRGARDRANRSK